MRALVLPVTLALSATLLAAPARAGVTGDLGDLVELSAERVTVAEAVAAAKWHTGAEIDDPAREEQILAAVAGQARRARLDPRVATAVMRDQIEANKFVQRGLIAQWRRAPGRAPLQEPDLSELRPVLDRITAELVEELKATEELRAEPGCFDTLARDAHRVAAGYGFDPLYTTGLVRALPSVCV
ncbi:chorismate mutase [Nocardiopsis sp. EMB25]|uniref:chorismate mutase n=1 Tax=Nocardiopsis sp. EMB25 TaxID=2835867 RepID=UPI0022848798|nr:chorismate mutase [Nocardiopsis sp. EMB25]MCY9783181.1 chorismate mutase [Nocardiopsis sp. EMB25]